MTATVPAVSASVAGSRLTSSTTPVSWLSDFTWNVSPRGLMAERCRTPVRGCWRTGDARLYTNRSICSSEARISSTARAFISSEYASPSRVRA